jgi:L-arabinose isomerase
VTVTGKSADGRFVAVYTNAFVVGWVATGQLTLYGADELEAVESAPNPAPVATLMAEVMAPVQVLDMLVTTPQE